MKVRENLSSVVSSIGKNNFTPSTKAQVGRVYGIVTTQDTPTKAMFEKVGGFNGIGSIFYLDYEQSKNIVGTINDPFLDTCKIAKPLFPQYQFFPVLGELVYLQELPSPATQIADATSQNYYISSINLWNNQQQNSQPANNNANLGITFVENPNIKALLPFEGDHIIQGRQGAGIRFSSTTKLFNDLNEWSSVGSEDSPITIITNGFSYVPKEKFHVEKINSDLSSVYLTSTQQLPLQTDKTGTLNPLTNPTDPSKYFNSQVVINSDRVTLNSKKDEVMIFAKTNVEINTNNIINLNAGERVHLNTNAVFLGIDNNQLPSQPVLLGYETIKVFEKLQESLTQLALTLGSVISAPEGAPIVGLNTAGRELLEDMKQICDLLEKIPSQKVFTS